MLNWLRREWLFAIAVLAFCVLWGLGLSGRLPLSINQSQHAEEAASAKNVPQKSTQDISAETVAFYTMVLALFTGGLLIVAGLQVWLLLKTDETSRRQVGITEKQRELEVRQHFLTHRPHLTVRNVRAIKPKAGDPISIDFQVINIGNSNAKVIASWFEATLTETYNAITPVIVGMPPRNFIGVVNLPVNAAWSEKPFTNGNWTPEHFDKAWGYFWCGKILYVDENGQNRRLGVIRKFNPDTGRFRPLKDPDPDYEYDD